MPSKFVTTAIVLFWLATTGWLVYRELAPRFAGGEPPPFTIDLTDEVGNTTVNWMVLQKEEKVGDGFTRIVRHPDRTFEFLADFRLNDFKLLTLKPKLKIVGSYRVTEEGNLTQTAANLTAEFPDSELALLVKRLEFDFTGDVRDRQLHPRIKLLFNGNDVNPFPPEPIPVAESGRVLNPMHLVHKITGLREGQTWMIPLMDPVKALPSALQGIVPGKELRIDQVQAEVKTEPLDWNRAETLCFKVEYRRPGEKVLAATWVRRRDGLVLQQWASYEGIDYTLRRVPGD
jgi:hypothetical protein